MESLVLITPPACEPIALSDAKDHLRVDFTDEDAVIQRLLAQARDQIESNCRRVLVPQTWLLKRDGFPGQDPFYTQRGMHSIILPKPPFQSLAWFKFVDVAGVLQTLTATDTAGNLTGGAFYGYQLDPGSETQPARLTPPWAKPWPPTRRIPNCVQIQFTAGYADPAAVATALAAWETANSSATAQQISDERSRLMGAAVPPSILNAIYLQLAWLYNNRGELAGSNIGDLAPGVRGTLSHYANWTA